MKTFRVVAKIKYEGNIFYVLINNSFEKYFIKEVEDGSIMYPTEEEYKALTNILKKEVSLASLNIGKNYNINPKVIMNNKKLVTLGTAILLIGGTIATDVNSNSNKISTNEVNQIQDIGFIEDDLRNKGDEFHSLYGYDDCRLYRIHKIIEINSKARIIECQDFDEFSKYIETKKSPTYNELRNTLRNNENIEKEYKQWLFEGIYNLEKVMPNLDLTVLNYNINRLKLEETTFENLNKELNADSFIGRFNQKTGEAYFVNINDKALKKFIVYHEVLGHGVSEASFERDVEKVITYNDGEKVVVNKEKIVVSDSMLAMKIIEDEQYNKNNIEYSFIGTGYEEGKADMIASFAFGELKLKGHSYIEQSEQLRIICEAIGLSLEDYISKGGAEILNKKMQQNDLENSLVYIFSSDIYVNAMKTDSLELIDSKDTFKESVLAFFKDYADNKIKNGENREEIVEKFSNILLKGGKFIRSAFNNEKISYEDFKEDIDKASNEIEID